MKFLCGNCKAKYQIADEKIAGRTLRMKCRRCEHEIVIRGDGAASEAGAPRRSSPPGRRGGSQAGKLPTRRGGSQAGKLPSRRGGSASSHGGTHSPAGASAGARRGALGAEFRRSSAAPPELESGEGVEWHVAINDVPVGPLTRAELAAKIRSGDVTKASLCWCEGMDDWRPAGEVAELKALLRAPGPPPVRPPSPARARGRSPAGSRAGAKPAAPRRPPSAPASPSVSSRPAARAEGKVVPIGGRRGAAAASSVEEEADLDEQTVVAASPLPTFEAPTSPAASGAAAASGQFTSEVSDPFSAPVVPEQATPAVPQQPVAAPAAAPAPAPATQAARGPGGLPVGAWIAIAGAMAFGVVLAFFVGMNFLRPPAQPVAANTTAAPAVPAPAPAVVQTPEAEVEIVEPDSEEFEPEEEEETGGGETSRRSRSRSSSSSKSSKTSKSDNLTAEQRAMLERMAGSGSSGANLAIKRGSSSSGSSGSGEGLNAQQLGGVVRKNRPALQRCYESAIRGMGDPPAIRMDVRVSVGMSGKVTSARVTGNDTGGLSRCIESTVRRWRFPTSGNTTETSFPVVFQPGG